MIISREESILYRCWYLLDNEKRIRVIQAYSLIFDWLIHELDHVLNDCNQHVEHVVVEYHFDP